MRKNSYYLDISKNVFIFASEFIRVMTYSEAQAYIGSPKKVIDDQGEKLEQLKLSVASRSKFRVSFEDEHSNTYVLDVNHSPKVGVKMSFNLRRDGNEGLARLDYNGTHTNPSPYSKEVPPIFEPYEGKVFNAESHLHLYVENYGLDWALPIEVTAIDPKTIDETNPDQGFKDAFVGFCKYLNVGTKIEIEIK